MTDPLDLRHPAGLVLRSARPQDGEALAALMNLPGVRRGTLQVPFMSAENVAARLEALQAGDRRIVATIADQLVGDASLKRFTDRRAHAGGIGMGVHDDWVGRGIGTALLSAIIDLADNWLGLQRLELTVFADNQPGRALYARFGFEIEGTLRDFALRDGHYADALTMARLRRP